VTPYSRHHHQQQQRQQQPQQLKQQGKRRFLRCSELTVLGLSILSLIAHYFFFQLEYIHALT
jgi:hypothetical protein